MNRGTVGVIVASAVLAGAGTAVALEALNVNIPILPAVGEASARACDTDGVSTASSYGNSSNKGIKVVSATVSDIASDCKRATVEFVLGGNVVTAFNGTVSGGSSVIATNIFTNELDSVRVTVLP
ncbi:MAG: hypothetical protein ACKOW5_10890 [Actinomycetales bacterium]